MATGRQLVARAETQFGDTYVFGGEIKPGTVNPNRYDCSEYTEWDTAMEGVSPPLPDGAANQFFHCKKHGRLITVDEARTIPGALLFVATPQFMRTGRGSGRDAFTHVAFSRGDGTSTAEARGKDWGVGSWPIGNRFTHAGLIPGVTYTSEEDDMNAAQEAQLNKVAADVASIRAETDKFYTGETISAIAEAVVKILPPAHGGGGLTADQVADELAERLKA